MSHGYGASEEGPYGLVAEFTSPEALMDAAEAAREAGYKKMDAYSPFPIHGLSEAIGFSDKKVPWTVFFCGLCGCFIGYSLEWYTAVIDYPLNVGGKPLNSLPAFIPPAYECTILLASFGAFFGMLAYNGLPKPYHSIFNTPGFQRASQDRFFLAIEVKDPKYDAVKTRTFMEGLSPINVSEVEA
ncbi:MAG TPA: DUF3341 domain-containing protein [Fimbriimonas sp.]|nr:DUF3341 domain-containing protein [Fimbriimonas sp.]